ncbi:MAG: 30S ribosomal protein S18 [Bacillales bacterium]|jgi:small subunit ribosomal protein S18|nr:30S ribosomal protein S18 [Bacillales bacterium]
MALNTSKKAAPKKKKACPLCKNKVLEINYSDVKLLEEYISPTGKILPRRQTGVCAKHQRVLANAIKISRQVALLPFVKNS